MQLVIINRPDLNLMLSTHGRLTHAECHMARTWFKLPSFINFYNLACTFSFDMLGICDLNIHSAGRLKLHVQACCSVNQASIQTTSVSTWPTIKLSHDEKLRCRALKVANEIQTPAFGPHPALNIMLTYKMGPLVCNVWRSL